MNKVRLSLILVISAFGHLALAAENLRETHIVKMPDILYSIQTCLMEQAQSVVNQAQSGFKHAEILYQPIVSPADRNRLQEASQKIDDQTIAIIPDQPIFLTVGFDAYSYANYGAFGFAYNRPDPTVLRFGKDASYGNNDAPNGTLRN